MGDLIVLSGMVFMGRHGVHEHEQRIAQPFEVDVEMAMDLRPAGASDDLARTVDYGRVFAACREIVEGPSVRLIETLAERIADAVLAAYPVDAVTVRVRKPKVGLPGPLAYAGVEIRRSRGA